MREALAERHVQDDRLYPVVTSRGSAQIPALGFPHQLANADTFWTTAALVQVALIIALAVEARSAMEGMEARWSTWRRRYETWKAQYDEARDEDDKRRDEAIKRDPALIRTPPPPSLREIFEEQPTVGSGWKELSNNVAVAAVAVVVMAVGTAVALFALVPVPYLGAVFPIIGLAVEAICIIWGLGALVLISLRRIFVPYNEVDAVEGS